MAFFMGSTIMGAGFAAVISGVVKDRPNLMIAGSAALFASAILIGVIGVLEDRWPK
jgi:choline dehydrogenase-like flavoprotein